MGKSKRGQVPTPVGGTVADVQVSADTNKRPPVFCLRYLQRGYDVSSLSREQQASFAVALEKRAKMTWQEITQAGRHQLGFEMLPRQSITASIPAVYEDTDKFMVLRYCGKLPMIGIRASEVFHVLWIAKNFNELYDHGS